MGYWVDMSTAYWTMDPSYIESVWWSLKQIFDKGLLVEDHRVAPYCPRCGTGLSDHEVAQGYETLTDPSVYVRLPVTSGEWAGKADLLVWTTTPWTLPSNTAVAVHPDVTYVVARRADDEARSWSPSRCWPRCSARTPRCSPARPGRDWSTCTYQRPFELVDIPDDDAHYVVLADYVTTEDGTGLVHQSPAFGADDLAVAPRATACRWSTRSTRPGTSCADVPLVGGHFFKAADAALVEDLQDRGVLFRELRYEHSYPHCWRCHTPLMYYALPSWYIRTTADQGPAARREREDQLVPGDASRHGRYGDWLNNNVDWALSRDRYWGTPLPIWRNDADPSRLVAVGSLAELSELTGRDLSDLDPHRPFIDDVTFTLPGEEGTYRRVPPGHRRLVRLRLDAVRPVGRAAPQQGGVRGGLPGAVHLRGDRPDPRLVLHADGGRHAGVRAESPTRTCSASGHILAEDGRKMSKHLGNILEPIPLMDRHGADAVRWFMLAGGSPWSARRVGHETLSEVVRKVLLTYWNTASFFTLYAEANGWDPAPPRRPRAPSGRCWTAGRWPSCAAVTAEVDDGAGGLRHPDAPAGCSPSSSTTCPTGTSAAPGAASGTATRPRWPRCTRCWTA